MRHINRETVLSYFLAFVVFWFGFNEVSSPANWTGLVPGFLGSGAMLTYLVVFHGSLLILCGLALVFRFHPRVAAGILALMLLDIAATLIVRGGLSDVAVRDIGLFGVALALSFRN